jgi:hypothetical protein
MIRTILLLVREATFKYVGSMLMEPNGQHGKYVASLHRSAAAALLLLASWHWYNGRDIVPTMASVLDWLLGCTVGVKVVQVGKEILTARQAPNQQPQQPPPVA